MVPSGRAIPFSKENLSSNLYLFVIGLWTTYPDHHCNDECEIDCFDDIKCGGMTHNLFVIVDWTFI